MRATRLECAAFGKTFRLEDDEPRLSVEMTAFYVYDPSEVTGAHGWIVLQVVMIPLSTTICV